MQAKRTNDPRILTIDLRAQRFGYAVFEGPKQLLDWGARFYPPGGKSGAVVAGNRIAALIKAFPPTVIVVRKVRHKMMRNSAGVQPILKAIRREASTHSIPVHFVARSEVREAFRILRAKSTYEIAGILTAIFPELLWRLPHKRKTYESEHPVMSIFDAIALGFTYWQLNGAWMPPPE